MKYHHAPRPTAPLTNAKWSIVPQETWTGSPSPRNASVASARIEPAITRTAFAKISGATFGRMWIPDQPEIARAHRLHTDDELPLPEREHLRADDARDRRPRRSGRSPGR